MSPVEVTENLLGFRRTLQQFEKRHGKKWSPYGPLRPNGTRWRTADRVAQGRMWRQYAGAWSGIPIDQGFVGYPDGHRVILDRPWVERVLCVSKAECLRRARAYFYLARRLRREGVR